MLSFRKKVEAVNLDRYSVEATCRRDNSANCKWFWLAAVTNLHIFLQGINRFVGDVLM